MTDKTVMFTGQVIRDKKLFHVVYQTVSNKALLHEDHQTVSDKALPYIEWFFVC